VARWVPLDAEHESRVLATGRMTLAWRMPWACPGCRKYGHVRVSTEQDQRTTDDRVAELITEDHREGSAIVCPYRVTAETLSKPHMGRRVRVAALPSRVVTGRLVRWSSSEKRWVWMAGKGEGNVPPQAWPPWK